jgi:hypothetical protein
MTEVSPEVLSKLVELIKASGTAGTPHDPFLEYLKGATDFFNSVAWPAAAVICILLFRQQLTKFIGDVDTVKLFGAEISRKLQQSAEEASATTGRSSAPSKGELIRATEVEGLAAGADVATIRNQAEELAAEYERVRHTMLPGDSRTRKMEVVVSKMRTLARAFYPLRHEFANSSSPGKRLMAIAALQVDPDYDMLEWLAERLPVEKPFVGYHAAVALLLAMRAPKAKTYLSQIEPAARKACQARGSLGSDSDRIRVLDDIERQLGILKE